MKLVLTTVENLHQADDLARRLLEKKLAACVSSFPVKSTYWWESKIERSDEILLLIKTSDERLEDLLEFLSEEHPYEVPEIIVLPVEGVGEPYERWIRDVTL
ncbi:MAG TPA: divalent-cation tolerance protein CutA [Candidatus Korarchaeota archaeon]|nr:divalent-cation tolerance protein CutA [Candidatus Korarchaeota archaeon]HDI74055.1 divalent-cation tolerance protein CutA [Candidatus Korarchaeota archaeon]